jgi:hypothetical protein
VDENLCDLKPENFSALNSLAEYSKDRNEPLSLLVHVTVRPVGNCWVEGRKEKPLIILGNCKD